MQTKKNALELAEELSDLADELKDQLMMDDDDADADLARENDELRQRLESTEDALRREIRKGFKPLVCDCPHCGKAIQMQATK